MFITIFQNENDPLSYNLVLFGCTSIDLKVVYISQDFRHRKTPGGFVSWLQPRGEYQFYISILCGLYKWVRRIFSLPMPKGLYTLEILEIRNSHTQESWTCTNRSGFRSDSRRSIMSGYRSAFAVQSRSVMNSTFVESIRISVSPTISGWCRILCGGA